MLIISFLLNPNNCTYLWGDMWQSKTAHNMGQTNQVSSISSSSAFFFLIMFFTFSLLLHKLSNGLLSMVGMMLGKASIHSYDSAVLWLWKSPHQPAEIIASRWVKPGQEEDNPHNSGNSCWLVGTVSFSTNGNFKAAAKFILAQCFLAPFLEAHHPPQLPQSSSEYSLQVSLSTRA